MTEEKLMIERDYFKERLTKSELQLVEALPHKLEDVLRQERADIMKREVRIDMFWGFFDQGRWPSFKRAVYKTLIHRFLKNNSGLGSSRSS